MRAQLAAVVTTATLLLFELAAQAPVDSTWDQRVQQRWPGNAIRKATEVEFEAWLTGFGATVDKDAATRAFVDRQWAAHGLAPSARGRTFLSPGGRGVTTAAEPTDQVVHEGPEPNGDPSAAGGGTPTAIACGDQGEGGIFPYGDRDWWRLDLVQPQTLTAWTGPGVGGTAVGDTMLELYDASGALLAANDDDPFRGHYSALAIEVPAGRYHVAVRGFADVRTGRYGLDVTCTPPGSGGTRRVPEAAEPNSSASRASSVTCGQQGYGDLQPGSDSDWWAFTVTSPMALDAEAGPDSASPCRDTYLYLRNSSGTVIAQDDDGGAGLYSRIVLQLQPGTYYLDMQSYSNNYAGGYTLDVRCGNGNGAPASFTAHPGGCAGTAGTPTVSARSGEAPILGSTFALELAGLPGGARALPLFGLSTTRTAGGVALPIDLRSIGAPGCRLEVSPESAVNVTADNQGRATFYLPVPYDTALLGLHVHTQAVVLDPGANGLGITVSNRGELVLGSSL